MPRHSRRSLGASSSQQWRLPFQCLADRGFADAQMIGEILLSEAKRTVYTAHQHSFLNAAVCEFREVRRARKLIDYFHEKGFDDYPL